MDPFTISAIIGIGSSLIAGNQADKDRKKAEAAAKAQQAEVLRIRKDTRFEEEPSILSVGASRKPTPSNPLASLQIGL